MTQKKTNSLTKIWNKTHLKQQYEDHIFSRPIKAVILQMFYIFHWLSDYTQTILGTFPNNHCLIVYFH